KFKKTNSGDCMLDNAIKYENAEMIKLLLKYGATSDNKYI
ncbi:TPA: T3SS effector OspC family protein, partial [Shigella flexneri 2a]